MELKTFQARSTSEALAKVKLALGREAMILHTRTVRRGGLFGIGARDWVEITATNDPQVIAQRKSAARPAHAPPAATSNVPQAPAVKASAPIPPNRLAAPSARQGPGVVPSQAVSPKLEAEVHEIKAMVERVLLNNGQAMPPDVPAELIEFYQRLIGQEVERELVDQVMQNLRVRLSRLPNGAEWSPDQAAIVQQELAACIESMLPPASPLQLVDDQRPTIVAVVGPTGVGKTTTLAKLAAHMKLREGRSVGLIATDTYRIAAVEQLKTYAQIMQIPLIAVTTAQEMRSAVEQLVSVDLILIDTAGRSQRDQERVDELRGLLAAVRPDQVHLAVSSASSRQQIREIIERFAPVGVSHLIFTKLDEAVGFGVILNVLNSAKLRMSYFTTGQSVPDDIEVAAGRRLAQLLLNEPAETTQPPAHNPAAGRPSVEIVA